MALFVCTDTNAQLLSNKGATLTIEPGATLFVEGGVENIDGGTIDNQGKIELEGDFENSATYTGTGDTVTFSGAADATMTSGGATIGVLEIAKDGGDNVILADNASVGEELVFGSDNTKVIIGDNDLAVDNNATVTGYDDNNYVVTNGTGSLVKEALASGASFTYPVGATDNTYNPTEITANGGHTADDMGVRVTPGVYADGMSGDSLETDVVHASWIVSEAVAGGSNYDMTSSWYMSDEGVNFDESLSHMSRHDGNDWDTEIDDFAPANGGNPNSYTRSGETEVGVFAVHSGTALTNSLVVGPRIFLQGGYDDVTGLIRDDIRAAGYIPMEEPYTLAGYNHKGLGGGEMVNDPAIFNQLNDEDDIVDWVVVEVRDATEDTVVASKSALINRAGYVVSYIDGTSSVKVDGITDGSYYVAVKHRNHLAVRSSGTLVLDETLETWDFTSAMAQANDIGNGNTPMAEVEANVFGMWGGDVNGNNSITYVGGANDKQALLTILGGAGSQIDDYDSGDINMNATVTYVGGGNDKQALLTILGGAGSQIDGHVTN